MKYSIALTVLILIVGGLPAWFQQQRLAGVEDERMSMTAEARQLGIRMDGDDGSGKRMTRRERVKLEKEARATAADLGDFALELEGRKERGEEPGGDFQVRAMEMMTRLSALSPGQLKVVIAGLGDHPGISGEVRGNIIGFSIMTLATDHPEAAVALYAESAGLVNEADIGGHVIAAALEKWAESDPLRAMEWLRANGDRDPGLEGDGPLHGVLAGAAVQDPVLAFGMLKDLELVDSVSAVHAIMGTGHQSLEQRTAVMEALRGHLAGISDEMEREETGASALEMFARSADQGGFDELTGWMESVDFTAGEKERFAGGLTYYTTRGDTGRWIEWLDGNLSGADVGNPVRELVGEWTQQDYLSAGTWLSEAADGPAKLAAVEAYAEAVAEYEPEIAGQWAMTLPEGTRRESALRAVYQNWPEGDPEGAAEFARGHGLE